jgi:hypothetical protein
VAAPPETCEPAVNGAANGGGITLAVLVVILFIVARGAVDAQYDR